MHHAQTIFLGWSKVTRSDLQDSSYIDFDWQERPLQILTRSPAGSRDRIWVLLIPVSETQEVEEVDRISLVVNFRDQPFHKLVIKGGSCSKDTKFDMPPSEDGETRIWTFTKHTDSITLYCNNVQIFNYQFSTMKEKCQGKLSKKFKYLVFSRVYDEASVAFRPKPGGKTLLIF